MGCLSYQFLFKLDDCNVPLNPPRLVLLVNKSELHPTVVKNLFVIQIPILFVRLKRPSKPASYSAMS